MVKTGLIVPPGGGSILSMAPGRSAALKLLVGDTGDRIMAFEETAPAGTETTFHLHRDSDEVAYVLSGEITFKIGDEVTVGGPGTCAFLPRGVLHAWKNTGAETGRVLFLYTPAGAGGFFEAGAAGRVCQWTGGQRDAAPAWLGDRRSAAFLTSGSVKSYQVLRRSARDELLRLSRLADTHSADEFRDQTSAAHGELIDIVQRLARQRPDVGKTLYETISPKYCTVQYPCSAVT